MRAKRNLFQATLFMILLCVIGCNPKESLLNEAPVVAEKMVVDGGELISLDPSLLKDTVTVPLSMLIEDFEIIKLDDRDDALVYPSPLIVSDNYILIQSARNPKGDYNSSIPLPCKLYDKKGKFLCDIGAIGQGPGEYQLIYHMQINEANQRIYLLPWQSDKILVYDMSGNVLEPIRLPYRSNKGVFKVEGDKVTVAVLPFPNIASIAWIQTVNGEILHEIPSGHLSIPFDFSNEIESSQNTGAFDLSFWYWPAKQDTLYHVDSEKGILVPRFTAKFEKDKIEPHSYMEWPNHFVGNTSTIYYVTDGQGERTEGKKPAYYIVDKQTLKGSFFRLENDYFGGIAIEWPLYVLNKGYYANNMDPGDLEEWLEKVLKSDKLSQNTRTKLTTIKDSIEPDDNNYVIYAKAK